MYQNTVEIVMIIVCELLSTINSKQNPQQYNQCIKDLLTHHNLKRGIKSVNKLEVNSPNF